MTEHSPEHSRKLSQTPSAIRRRLRRRLFAEFRREKKELDAKIAALTAKGKNDDRD
jgi:hypothetical protein